MSMLKPFALVSYIYCGLISMAWSWTPGAGNESAVSGFEVDSSSREDVLSFYNSIYLKSEEFRARIDSDWIGGDLISGEAGTISSALRDDSQRRINFYRAMVGLNADITLNETGDLIVGAGSQGADASTPKHQASQEAALMFAKQGAISHYPASSWTFYTKEAANAAANSNLALGHYGPDAIDAYIEDTGSNNQPVGHRRWLMYSRATKMATGDVPEEKINVLYVMHNNADLLPAGSDFIAWPNAGYCPDSLIPERWSLSFPGANFSKAVVSVTDSSGNAVSTEIISDSDTGYADNTLVWTVAGFPKTVIQDDSYTVTVSKISGSGPASYTYTVNAFNPNVLSVPIELYGDDVVSTSGGKYTFDSVVGSTGYQQQVYTTGIADWEEGAEAGTTEHIIDRTGSAYELINTWSSYKRSGSRSFRLAFPSATEREQSFEIDRLVLSSEATALQFYVKRGYMVSTTEMRVQVSTNQTSWTTVGDVITGDSSNKPDSGFSLVSVELPQSDSPLSIRFFFSCPSGTSLYTGNQSNSAGIYIDDIQVVNAEELVGLVVTDYDSSAVAVSLDQFSAGETLQDGKTYTMQLRSKVGLTWMPYGPSKEVTVVASLTEPSGFDQWAEDQGVDGGPDDDSDNDGVSNLIEYAFSMDPSDSNAGATGATVEDLDGEIIVRRGYNAEAEDVLITAECSEDMLTWEPLPVTFSDGVAQVNLHTNGLSSCFMRWNVAQN